MAESPTARDRAPTPEARRSFFEVYKRTQGTRTRIGTASGAGVIVVAGANFLREQLPFESEAWWAPWLQSGIPVMVVLGFALLLWWVLGVNRKSCDFMIATEGEMKKVSWASRKELFGSTQVVILFTVALATALFVVDVAFMAFFNSIDVLRGASIRETLGLT
ncbi:MAG: preprotein translocase subunit SecE [Planctomycetota bacterium]